MQSSINRHAVGEANALVMGMSKPIELVESECQLKVGDN